MDSNLGRDEIFWRIGHEKSKKLLSDIQLLDDINFKDEIGRTYLHMACSAHNLDVARVLLDKGAHPNCKDLQGRLPIMSALGTIHETNADFLKLFLEHGLDLTQNVNGTTLKDMIESFEDTELMKVISEYVNG